MSVTQQKYYTRRKVYSKNQFMLIHKRLKTPKGQSKMENAEKLAT
jgi:hypothetical protein